jgi:hypothetical protein
MHSLVYWLPPFLYFIVVFAVVVFFLHLVFRLVKAVEKIADIYSRNNSSL